MACEVCKSIVDLGYLVCGETDDLEYLVEVADHSDGEPRITVVALQH